MEFLYFLIPGITIPVLAVSCYCCICNRVSTIERRLANLENRTTVIYHPPTSYSMSPYQPAPSAPYAPFDPYAQSAPHAPLDPPSDLEWGARVV